jgi:hypothetical protein
MIPNFQIATKALVEIEEALALTPADFATAQSVCEDSLDFATFPLFQRYEPGEALKRVDTRAYELSRDIEQLQRVLNERDREAVYRFLASIKRRVQALSAESVAE